MAIQPDGKRAKRRSKVKKIWVAMSTPFQANFFAPLIKELEKEYEFVVTAREHDRITSILTAKHIEYLTVGKHGGRSLTNKLEAYADGIREMLPIVQREAPDLLLTERWPEAVRVAFGLDIPSWGIFYDERETHVNRMVFPLVSRVFSPRFYSFQELFQNGVTDPESVVWFNGFHTCYLKGETMSESNPYRRIGVDAPVLFVRPEPEFASFFPKHEPTLERAVKIIQKSGKANLVVLPRTDQQRQRYESMGATILDSSYEDSPVAHADVTLGAAETMLMESFILGKPTVSSIYWAPSRPVTELHRYVRHSTEPAVVAEYVERFLDDDEEKKAFAEKASLLVRNMDNPVRLMINEIKKLSEEEPVEVSPRRRSQTEILIDIIQSVSFTPLRPTHIMKSANISYNELKKIVETLERRRLIAEENTLGGKFYQATSEGLRLIEDYKGVKERLFA
jgi:predicted glycosyltransferase/predicted transcriptional regulator